MKFMYDAYVKGPKRCVLSFMQSYILYTGLRALETLRLAMNDIEKNTCIRFQNEDNEEYHTAVFTANRSRFFNMTHNNNVN